MDSQLRGTQEAANLGHLSRSLSKKSSSRYLEQAERSFRAVDEGKSTYPVELLRGEPFMLPFCSYDAAYFARLGLDTWGIDIATTAVEAAKAVSRSVLSACSLDYVA